MNKDSTLLFCGIILGASLISLINYLQTGCSPWDPRYCKRHLDRNPWDPRLDIQKEEK